MTEAKKKGEACYGRFLKMIDDLQTPKHKTNHFYRRRFPLILFNIYFSTQSTFC